MLLYCFTSIGGLFEFILPSFISSKGLSEMVLYAFEAAIFSIFSLLTATLKGDLGGAAADGKVKFSIKVLDFCYCYYWVMS